MDFKRSIIFILFAVALTSCVGKVEDKNPKATKNAETGTEIISFSGVTKVEAISHDKVEVSFFPSTGQPSDLTYLVYVNESLIPIEVKGDSLTLTKGGFYTYVVSGLRVNTEYSFSVGVRNGKTGSETENNKALNTKTFNNYTADFGGISSAAPAAGESGQTTINVEWVPAVSLGSQFSPRANDPIAYEVAYLSSEDGTASDLINDNNPKIVRLQNPSSLPSSPQLTTERVREVSGLKPGTEYHFRVRAIHKAYVDFSLTPGYKTEQNNKVFSTSTLESSGLFDWSTESFAVERPLGEDALTKIDIKWATATGPFVNYRVYNVKVGEPTEALVDVQAAAPTMDAAYIDGLNASDDYTTVTADKIFVRLENLESYAYYKTVMVACRTLGCTDAQRIMAEPILYRVVPSVAPFSGLLQIRDPIDLANLNQISVKFDPPVVAAGYVNRFELYCYDSLTDASPTELVTSTANSSGKAGCNGLTRVSASPSTTSGYESFKEIVVQGNFISPGQVVSDREYCFAAIPVIEGNNFTKRDLSSAIVRCKTIEVKVPTMEDFPGATKSCSVGFDSLTANWSAPTTGLYDRYEVFYKEDDGSAFKFSDAIAGAAGYSSVDNITTLSANVTGLTPGKSYLYGVLSYISGGTKIYSESNLGITRCTLPLPTARFEEWVDIFAVGPKADGRVTPALVTKEKSYLFETLTSAGETLEVDVNVSDSAPTTAFEDQFGVMNGGITFQGVYGSNKQNPAAGMHQYSNSGIIRLAWKDVTLDSGSMTMKQAIDAYETATQKRNRTFGYRIYRSDDNQETWKELTSDDYTFQSVTNAGLLHPISYSERVRSNAPVDTFNAIMFTDYSVKHAGKSGNVDRARVYHYKIVPVFNGTEIKYDREEDNPQHIVKVTLPPENMALVHRLIANRQTCLEVGKTITSDVSQHYTCDWNGVGARGLSVPWIQGLTVYDFGPDLLMDRYELGCNYTRGDYSNSNSIFSGTEFNFFGLNDNGINFVGCFAPNGSRSGPSNTTGGNHPGTGNSYTDRAQFRVGDCIGDNFARMYDSDTVCADPATAQLIPMTYPGIGDGMGLDDCTNSANLADNYFDFNGSGVNNINNQAIQSEYAAVYYNRYDNSTWSRMPRTLRGANGNDLNVYQGGLYASRCMINLPVQDNSATVGIGEGRLKTRWIAANKLGDLTSNSTNVNLYSQTVNQVLSNPSMHDSLSNAAPSNSYVNLANSTRYDGNTPIAKIISSNDAKLPPLDRLTQDQGNQICQTYEVEVGTYDDVSENFTQIGPTRNKRMMRRVEGIAASALPKNLTNSEVTAIENGGITKNPVTSGVNYNPGCNSYERDVPDGLFYSQTHSGEMIGTRMPGTKNGTTSSPTRPLFITGSSFYDDGGVQYSTQACTSRYGVQDLIGNMKEMTTDLVFCDYSGEFLYLGVDGVQASSVPTTGNRVFHDSGLASWVQSSSDTGRCSVVENGSYRNPAYSFAGNNIPMVDIFGNLNTTIVETINTLDLRSPSYYRGGDGFFMDFGQTNYGPPISLNDTLALEFTTAVSSGTSIEARSRDGSDPRRGRYFNPIIGMPLECADTVCNNSLDNKSITTSTFVTDFSLTPGDFSISNFPVRGSQIYSDGMSEVNRSFNYYTSPDTTSYDYNFIQTINVGTQTTQTYQENNGSLKSSDDNDGTSVTLTQWRLVRDSSLQFKNFGGVDTDGTGRYSMEIVDTSIEKQKSSMASGVRCVVRLGELQE